MKKFMNIMIMSLFIFATGYNGALAETAINIDKKIIELLSSKLNIGSIKEIVDGSDVRLLVDSYDLKRYRGLIRYKWNILEGHATIVSNTDSQKLLRLTDYDGTLLCVELNIIYRKNIIYSIKHCIAPKKKVTLKELKEMIKNGEDVTNVDTSEITDMKNLFRGNSTFNQDISGWDVSNVTNMSGMFQRASAFNQDISGWDVSSVTDMSRMFQNANSFNQNIGSWDVSSVVDMFAMFCCSKSFNQDIGNWDVSNVSIMDAMFIGTEKFNQDIGGWNVSNVTIMSMLFMNTKAFNQDISDWDVSSVKYMSRMFSGAKVFDQNIGDWDISSVKTMHEMFHRSKLSTENYDSLLIGWSTKNPKKNVALDGGNSTYSSKAVEARETLRHTYGWDIVDRGLIP